MHRVSSIIASIKNGIAKRFLRSKRFTQKQIITLKISKVGLKVGLWVIIYYPSFETLTIFSTSVIISAMFSADMPRVESLLLSCSNRLL